MPRKSKPKPIDNVVSAKVSQTKRRRKPSSPVRLPATSRGDGIDEPCFTVITWADPTAGVCRPDAANAAALPEPAKPRNKNVGSWDCSEPRSAWIVFGSGRSFQSDDDLTESGGSGEWTATKNVEIGDTLFFYFIAPYMAIHFLGRAASEPWYDESTGQWWVHYDSMVRIEPITLPDICTMFGEKRFLPYFKGAKYLRPDFANRLLERAKVAFCPLDSAREIALQRVVGRKELGDPKTISLDDLRRLDSTAFLYEEDVEYHFVEPLLRLADVDKQAHIQRKYDLPKRKTADYAALDRGRKAFCIIEVKRELSEKMEWKNSSEYRQAKDYAEACKAPGFVLTDRDRVFCFRTVDEVPCLTLDRSSLDSDGLRALRAHILGQGRAGASSRPRR